MRVIPVAAAAVAASALAASAAEAHVTLNPRSVLADSFGRLDVRVPNERDSASTKTVVVNFPAGFYSVSTKRVWGWKAKVTMKKLAKPVKTDEGNITERVAKVTWRATGKSSWIAPGQFEEFGLSARIPNVPGTALRFPSRQTYSNGEVVKWTGAAGSDTPAPVVNVTAPPTAVISHTPLKSVSPARNSTRRSAVKSVRATFRGRMQTGIIEIKTASGATVALKSSGLTSNKAVLRAVPKTPLRSGTYKVSWRARAGDGHSEKGSWRFKVKL